MNEPWGIAVRISRARDGSTLGVERQEPPCRALVERLGGQVARVYVRNDVSGYSGGFPVEDALADLRAGKIRGLVAWQADRLTRQMRHAIPLLDTVAAAGAKLATVTGEYDLSTAAGRFNFRNLANMAEFESDLRGERLRLMHDQLAERGAWHGGVIPFGYRSAGKGRIEPDPVTGPLVQEAVRRVLRRESVGTVIRDWNARGIASPRGARWQSTPMRKLLTNPVLAGLRQHRGEVIGDGNWSALISRAEHERLLATFGDKQARRRHGRGRKFLLSGGLLVCRECETELYSGRRGNGTAVYVCKTDIAGACGKVQIQAEPLELLIREAVVDALAGPKLTRMLAEREDADVDRLARSLHEDEEELKALATLKGQRRFTLAEWLALRDPIEERIAQTRAKLQASTTGDLLADLPRTREELAQAFGLRGPAKARSVDWQQARVRLVLNHITVASAKRVGRDFEDRLDPHWRA
jgi:DNA invertase Pin-like site-specific DNA recombinase